MNRVLLAALVATLCAGSALADSPVTVPPQALLPLPNTWTGTPNVFGSAAFSSAGNADTLQVNGVGTADTTISIARFSNNTSNPRLILYKSLGTSVGTETAVTANTLLGQIGFYGADGTTAGGLLAGSLVFQADNTFASGSGQSEFRLSVRNGASSTVVLTGDFNGFIYSGPSFVKVLDASGNFTGPTLTLTGASASILTAGLTGATNPAFQVDASTASQAAGLKVTGAATGGTVAVAAIDSGSNTNLTVNGKGTGTVGIGTVSTGLITLGGASGTSTTISGATITLSNITTGTNADVLCVTAGKVVTLQAAASCTISSLRFKEQVHDYSASVLSTVASLRTITYRLKDWKKNADPNAEHIQLGLVAEDIAKKFPLCSLYERDMKTPKSYREECMIAALVASVRELKASNDNLSARLAKVEGHH